MKKIALSGSRAKLKILNGKVTEGFQILKTTAKKFKSFATDLADRIPQALASRISLNLFSHFESKSSKRLGIPKGVVLGGVLTLMCSLPAAGQVIINAPTTAALDAAIVTANGTAGAYEIRLDQGKIYTLTASLTTVANNGAVEVVCTGTTNAIINGANNYRPFTMAVGSDLTITKITITSGSALKGGAIYNNQGNLTISSSTITGNQATGVFPNGRGAGIYSKGGGATATTLIQNSTISINSASARGGGIYSRLASTITVDNSLITGNSGKYTGGGIYNRSANLLTISASSITGNTCPNGGLGGGIYNNATGGLSISSSSLSNNTADKGGGIYNKSSTITILSSTLSGNKSLRGGALFSYRGTVSVTNSLITQNEASGANPLGRGAGLYITGNGGVASLTIQGSTISINSATNFGGGIFSRDGNTLTIASSSILNNFSGYKSGGINNYVNSPITITCSTISGNIATNRGGAMQNAFNSPLTISNSIISNNKSLTASAGGIFNTQNCPFTLTNSTISNNSSTLIGGGIQNSVSPLTIVSSTISNNSSANEGGGIYNSANSILTIRDTDVFGNTSASQGGGITNKSGSALSIFSSSFTGNISGGLGGGLYNNDSNLTIQASSFTTNQATNRGGAMIIYGAAGGGRSAQIQNTTISGNTSNNSGGGIFHDNRNQANDITLQHVTLLDNTGNGGASTGANFGNAGTGGTITIQNSIIGNSLGTGGDFGNINAATVVATGSIVEDASIVSAGNVLNVEPLLGVLTLNSGFLIHPVKTTSSAINAGMNLFASIPTDQVGNARDTSPHMGAVEVTIPGVCMVVAAPTGVTNTWIGCTNGDWNTASNWSKGLVPVATDVVYIPISAATQLVIDEIAICHKMIVQIGAKCIVDYDAGGKLLIKF